jgi:hypothetical protein
VGIGVAASVGKREDCASDGYTDDGEGAVPGDEFWDIVIAAAPTIANTAKMATAPITYSFFILRGGGADAPETGPYWGGL